MFAVIIVELLGQPVLFNILSEKGVQSLCPEVVEITKALVNLPWRDMYKERK